MSEIMQAMNGFGEFSNGALAGIVLLGLLVCLPRPLHSQLDNPLFTWQYFATSPAGGSRQG